MPKHRRVGHYVSVQAAARPRRTIWLNGNRWDIRRHTITCWQGSVITPESGSRTWHNPTGR